MRTTISPLTFPEMVAQIRAKQGDPGMLDTEDLAFQIHRLSRDVVIQHERVTRAAEDDSVDDFKVALRELGATLAALALSCQKLAEDGGVNAEAFYATAVPEPPVPAEAATDDDDGDGATPPSRIIVAVVTDRPEVWSAYERNLAEIRSIVATAVGDRDRIRRNVAELLGCDPGDVFVRAA